MTREECLRAISEAFDGCTVEASQDYWNVQVYSNPSCEVVLTPAFVEANIDADGISPRELTTRIKNAPAGQWHRVKGSDHTPAFRCLIIRE